MERVRERLKVVLPITLLPVLMLLHLNTRSLAKTSIIILAVPFSAVGAIWLCRKEDSPEIHDRGRDVSFVLELVVYPAIYEIWRWHFGLKRDLAPASVSDPQGDLLNRAI